MVGLSDLAGVLVLVSHLGASGQVAVAAAVNGRTEDRVDVSCAHSVSGRNSTERTIAVADRVAMMRTEDSAFREELGASYPLSTAMISIMLVSAHRSTTKLSYIATRDESGLWSVSRVGQTTELQDSVREVEPETITTLSRERGAALDSSLADHCLYELPFQFVEQHTSPVAQWQTSLAVMGPHGQYAGIAFGPLPDTPGRIVSLITGW